MNRTAVLATLTLAIAPLAAASTREPASTPPARSKTAQPGNKTTTKTTTTTKTKTTTTTPGAAQPVGPTTSLPPNEMGRIPVLEYHVISDRVTGPFERPPARFRQDLETLYRDGYRPVTMSDVVDRKIRLPMGTSPVVITFDDAPPSQFRYIERNRQLIIDSTSAVGIWLDFAARHPGWTDSGVFCMLPAAAAGHAFFGNNGVEGQKSEWRFRKVRFLREKGFELCDHTLWHARLDRYSDAVVQEQIARGQLAIDSAVAGYDVRTFALPFGLWPKNRSLAWQGSWTDPRTGRTIRYHFDAILEVAGEPSPGPYAPGFDPHRIHRQIMTGNALERLLQQLDRPGLEGRYVSDGKNHLPGRPSA